MARLADQWIWPKKFVSITDSMLNFHGLSGPENAVDYIFLDWISDFAIFYFFGRIVDFILHY